MGGTPRKPVIGVLCCNELADRPVQVVASRFVLPLRSISDATVLLVPALIDGNDAGQLTAILDGLLLTGSRSHVAPSRYGSDAVAAPLDELRDEVALSLAGRMIEAGKPVFGICRGMQEINVLFGGTLAADRDGAHLHGTPDDYASLFDHRHDVELVEGGRLAGGIGTRRLSVNSVHYQGVDRLGGGLSVEAVATDDGLIEAFSAKPCGADVLAVQWHPEWNVESCADGRAFFTMIGTSLRR